MSANGTTSVITSSLVHTGIIAVACLAITTNTKITTTIGDITRTIARGHTAGIIYTSPFLAQFTLAACAANFLANLTTYSSRRLASIRTGFFRNALVLVVTCFTFVAFTKTATTIVNITLAVRTAEHAWHRASVFRRQWIFFAIRVPRTAIIFTIPKAVFVVVSSSVHSPSSSPS